MVREYEDGYLGQKEIGDKDDDGYRDHRARRGAPDALGAAACGQAEMTAEERDDRAEERALVHAAEVVAEVHRAERGAQEEPRRDVELSARDEHRAAKAEDERERAEHGH